MSKEFSLDLRLARRRSGLTQEDIAHLLGVKQPTVSRLEKGEGLPTLKQLIVLSLIYDRTFESAITEIKEWARTLLRKRILLLPHRDAISTELSNRETTIERLARELADEDSAYGYA